MLKEEEGGFAGADGEVLLYFLALLASEGRIRQHHVEAILLLNVGEVFGEVLVWMIFGASMPCRIMFMMAMT